MNKISFLLVFINIITGVPGLIRIEPLGQTGSQIRDHTVGRYEKSWIKSHSKHVSWSVNLDEEVETRDNLCPNLPDKVSYQYRYHNGTRKCYQMGTKGPCGENMSFYGWNTNAIYGECDCAYNSNSRPLIYYQESNACYFVFTKGYCNPGQFLSFDVNWDVICTHNICSSHYNDIISPQDAQFAHSRAAFVEFVPQDEKKCTLLGRSCSKYEVGSTEWESVGHLPHEMQFVSGSLYPKCAPTKIAEKWEYPTPKLQCMPGALLAVNKNNISDGYYCQYHSVYER